MPQTSRTEQRNPRIEGRKGRLTDRADADDTNIFLPFGRFYEGSRPFYVPQCPRQNDALHILPEMHKDWTKNTVE